MRRVSALLLSACASLFASAAASAGEVKDVLVLPDGAVFVALSDTPATLEAEAQAGRLEVRLGGWSAAPRQLAPYGRAGFSALTVTQAGLVLEGGFAGAEAELRQGGVLIRFHGAAPAPAHAGGRSTPAPVFTRGGAAEPQSPAAAEAGERAAPASPPAPAPAAAAEPAPDRLANRNGAPAEEARASADPVEYAATDAAPGPCDAQASALADAPWDLDLIVAQADCLAEAGERQNAAGLYEQVLAFQPEHFRAALGLARLRQQSGRHDDAARLFETAAGSALTDGEALAARAAARRARERGEN